MQLGVWGEALTLSHARDNSRYKRPVAQTCEKTSQQLTSTSSVAAQIYRFCSLLQFMLFHNNSFSSHLTIIKSLLIGPVGPFLHVLKMRVLLAQACIKHRHFHARSCTITQKRGWFPSKLCHMREQGERSSAPTGVPHLPENISLEDLGDVAGDGTQQAPAGVATGRVPEA